MKKVLILVVVTMFGMNVSAKVKREWTYSKGKLENVFRINISTKSNELVRLYNDGTYEHLRFIQKSSGREEVDRNLGSYSIKKGKISFQQPDEKEFDGKFHYGSFFYNGKLYQSFFDMKFRAKNEVFKTTSDKKYFKPFFMCLNRDEVVSNYEAGEQINLQKLVDYILTDKNKEEEKLMAIIHLVIQSVGYDSEGSRSNSYANKQNDVKNILAGKKRLAVCSGYSFTVKELCTLAGLQVQEVFGHTKQGLSDLTTSDAYHSWNIVTIDGEKRMYDITLADKGKTIDMTWIDVDPLIMIETHFPDMQEDQLLSFPLTQDQFLSSNTIIPSVESVNPLAINIPARMFVKNNFELILPGKHTVIVSIVQEEKANKVNSGSRTNSKNHVGSGHYDGDSTYFIVPLTAMINPLEIEIDGKLAIKTTVFKGGQTDLMNYYISKADKKKSDAYVKAIVASIRLSDANALKELVGSNNSIFFDKNGKLKIDKKLTLACFDWTGELTPLTETSNVSSASKSNGESTETTESQIDIPGKVKFILVYDGVYYSLSKVEYL